MLFLGNSYTFQNELDRAVADVFAAAGETVEVARLAEPGWRFVDHLDAIGTAGSAHAEAFDDAHDWVILQEQSQIPGFPDGQADVEASRDAAVELDTLAAGTGGETMFLMTWGRRDGDASNPDLYPDFLTMQARLTEGYVTYVDLASADGTPAWIAPAGLAWQRVYEDVLADGGDPTASDSPFFGLYVDDGSHPSQRGTYLAACVVYASLTGRSPEGLDAPETVADAAYLQSVAAAVVLDGEGFAYPWEGGGGDTGGGDTGGGDTDDPEDTGAPDADTASDLDGDAPKDDTDGDCGCATGTGPAAAVGLWAAALVWIRRRRS